MEVFFESRTVTHCDFIARLCLVGFLCVIDMCSALILSIITAV
ncbi:putative membrane protein [Anaplasma phagocytophilum str. ApNP]|uniref:Putative membrane protein n=1 Tax=Anaplasma phagocytophilum str. ApNP TaxID=1359153 RepID=A0A0F3NLH0_ANAPH|nr:putative membrane protein [Anaplasma phagocytophilum str. ApNP]